MKQSLKKLIATVCALTCVGSSFVACTTPGVIRDVTIDETKTQLYVSNNNAGIGTKWIETIGGLFEEEFAKLLTEQRAWIAEKEEKIKEAGKEVEGGSLYPTVIYGEGRKLTEARVYELYEILKKIN